MKITNFIGICTGGQSSGAKGFHYYTENVVCVEYFAYELYRYYISHHMNHIYFVLIVAVRLRPPSSTKLRFVHADASKETSSS